MPATSSGPGSQPESVARRPKVKRPKPSYPETSASAGGGPSRDETASVPSSVTKAARKAKRAARTAAAIANTPSGPSVSEANTKTRQRVRRKKNAMRAKELRQTARAQGTPTKQFGMKTPAFILKEQAKADRQTAKKIKADRAKLEQERWDDMTKAEQLIAGGVVGQFDRKASNKGRQLLYGDKNPSAATVALALAPVPAYKAAKVGQAVLRGKRVLNTAEKAADAKRTIEAANTARKAERKAAQGTKATAKQMGKSARKRLQKTEVKAAAKRTGARTADRAVRSVTSPAVIAASTNPGKVGHQIKENVEATIIPGKAANPVKTARTTVEALPGLFTAGASVAGAAIKSAKTGDPGYIGGSLKAIGSGANELLRPLVEGDSEEIAKAMEEDIGYPLAPLLPRGAISKPGKAVGRVAAAPVVRPAKAIAKVRRAKEIKKGNIPTDPGRVRKVRQRVAGGKVRRDVAVTVTRPRERGTRRGVREAREIVGQKVGRTSRQEQSVSAAAVLARYGIGRKDTLKELDNAIKDVGHKGDVVNDHEIAAWLHQNPEVLADENFWRTVDEWHAKQDPKVTSKRAQFMAQAEVAGVAIPKTPRMLRREAKRFARKAGDATGRDAEIWSRAASRRRAHAKRIEAYWKTKGVKRNQAAERFHPDEVEQMVERTRATRSENLEDPIWLSEPSAKTPIQSGRASKFGLKSHASTGSNRRAGRADRSLPALLETSVIIPHVRKGIARGVRQTIEKYRLVREIKGKNRHAFTPAQIFEMHKKGEIDLREVVGVPARDWQAAMESEAFDLDKFYGSEVAPALRGDVEYLRQTKAKGTKYVLLPREVGRELDYQLNPREGGPLEKGMRSVAGIASRIVLFSPAWAAAQVVNESSQLIADAGLRGASVGLADLVKLRFTEPQVYRDILDHTGAGSPVAHPFGSKVGMNKGDYISTSNALRGMRRHASTRAMLEFFNTFSNFDRWKTTRLRAIGLLAKNNKEFGQFTKGLGGSLRSMDEISKKLGKMSHAERHKFIASTEGTRILERHLDHVDDMLGNWEAFTRYERSLGPLVAFYPFLRMSLRWTFRTFPQGHPIKAQILYLLSQQNREQLEKLTGFSPSAFESAFPAMYNQEGQVEGVLPGGARFGAPASNTIVEAVGEANLAGLSRLLNPALSTTATAFFGVSPFTGRQDAPIGTTEWGINAAEALLSLAPPARFLGLNTLGKKSAAAQAFADIDPERAMRSALNPFIGMSATSFRDQTVLSHALEDATNKPEYGDLVDAIMAKDKARAKELAQRVDLAKDAQKVLDKMLPSQPGENRALSQAGEIDREGTKADYFKKNTGGGNSIFGGGGSEPLFPSGGNNEPLFGKAGGQPLFK